MTREQLAHIQGTSDILMSVSSRAADRFYERVFEAAPSVRPLFPEDMTKQKIKLMDTLAAMVGYMTHPEMFTSVVRQVGRRHFAYGAVPEHYGVVGACLLDTLAEVLGSRFTPDVRAAWAALYGEIANGMIEGQESERGAAT